MKTQKPSRLKELIEQFMAEQDKIQIGKHYIAIVEETKRITFKETNNCFANNVYKNLIRLSIKDYIHSGHSAESIRILNEVIEVISEAEITVEE